MKPTTIGLLFMAATAALAQNSDGDTLVTVPQRYVSAEGLEHKASPEASKWLGIGKEIGIATKEGLDAVVNETEKFGATRVGNFVMFMIAWKLIGHDVLRVVVGIPLFLVGIGFWVWSLRRFFFGRRVLVKEDHAAKTKEYGTEPAYKFESGDGRAACGAAHAIIIAGWCIVWICLIFV